jgi:hypothetical protein
MFQMLCDFVLDEMNANPVMQLPNHPKQRYCSEGRISVASYISVRPQEPTLAHSNILLP